VQPGKLDVASASYVLATLSFAAENCLAGEFAAMVTAPVQKSVIADSGVAFSGHTEFLAEQTGSDSVVMLLAAGDLRVALATTHLPLREVPDALSAPMLTRTLRTLHDDLVGRFGLLKPHISVLGLNPHAGEAGHLGCEERDIIGPVCDALRLTGFDIEGPLPADTAFNADIRQRTDAYLAMYHDQGLPVLKFAGFGRAVNITLGLPIIRTSVDHGTALDLAGTGKADAGSLKAAIGQAIKLAGNAG
jgi:4-hydroxythreonine-4-phosphate dehydrogenase